MQNEKSTEKDLILEFKHVKEKRDCLKEALKKAQYEYDKAESALIEFLEAHSLISTAKYEDLGYAHMQKPKLYANCRQEDMHKLFAFLKKQNREDLIKTVVSSQGLSAFTRECIENGSALPDFITYYLKASIRLFAEGR